MKLLFLKSTCAFGRKSTNWEKLLTFIPDYHNQIYLQITQNFRHLHQVG